MGFKYHPGLCLVHVTCHLVFEPLKGAFPAACPSAGQAGLSLSAFIWATEKIQGFAGLGEAGHQGKKISQALQVTSWKCFPAKEPGSAGRSSFPGPALAGSGGRRHRRAVTPLEFQPPGCSLKKGSKFPTSCVSNMWRNTVYGSVGLLSPLTIINGHFFNHGVVSFVVIRLYRRHVRC